MSLRDDCIAAANEARRKDRTCFTPSDVVEHAVDAVFAHLRAIVPEAGSESEVTLPWGYDRAIGIGELAMRLISALRPFAAIELPNWDHCKDRDIGRWNVDLGVKKNNVDEARDALVAALAATKADAPDVCAEADELRAENAQLKDHRDQLQKRCGELLFRARGVRYAVHEFREAMGLPVRYAEGPSVPEDRELVRLAVKLVAEEFFELLEAMVAQHRAFPSGQREDALRRVLELVERGSVAVDLPAAADALADLDYVVEGARCVLGIDGDPVLAEVHAANMLKAGGPVRADGKHLKPDGWQPPDIHRVLREQGWKG